VIARIIPLIIGPRVCPTSIIMLRKPKDVPTNFEGAISEARGDVEEITNANPIPYPIESSNSVGK